MTTKSEQILERLDRTEAALNRQCELSKLILETINESFARQDQRITEMELKLEQFLNDVKAFREKEPATVTMLTDHESRLVRLESRAS